MKLINKYKMFIFYYILGIVNALALSAYPLIYIDKGFLPETINTLISISFLAMILQPLIGIFTDKLADSVKSLKVIIVVYIISSLLMFLSIKLFVVGLVLNSITRNSLVPIIDGYVTQNANSFEHSYAKMRAALPIGFGSAFIVSLLFIKILRLPISGMLIFMAVIGFVLLLIVNSVQEYHNELKVQKSANNIVERSNKSFIIMLMFYFLLYAGLYQVSSSYLSLYMTEINHTALFIGMLNLIMIIPQIFLLFNYDRIFKNTKNTTTLLLAVVIGIIQATFYVLFAQSAIMLIFASILGGIQLVLFPAAFYPLFTKAIKSDKLSTVLTLNTSLQAIWIGVFNQVIISRVYDITATYKSVYLIVIIVMICAMLPVVIYRRKSHN